MIERVVRYRFDGQEFHDLNEVAKHVENQIGKIIDSTPNRLNADNALAVYDVIVNNRQRLCQLLSATYDNDPDELQGDERSIFDLARKRK
jgi:hypothetical protein